MAPLTTTVVPPWRQGEFKDWLSRNKVTDYLHPQSFYDYGGAFMSGLNRDPVTEHWPDTFKQPGHPTFSDQSQYADETAGHWTDGRFVAAAHSALGLPSPVGTTPSVPWRTPAQPFLTHEGIARRLAELDRLASLDQMPAGARALDFLRGLNPLAGLDPNAPASAPWMRPAQQPTPEMLTDPLAQYRQLGAAIPEGLDNFQRAVAARDPHALGLLAQMALPIPGLPEAEAGKAVAVAPRAAREVLPNLEYTVLTDQAHQILGLPTSRQLAAPAKRKLLTAGAPAQELIEAPAVRGVDGEWYTGRNHDEAAANAAAALRQKPGGLDLMRNNGGSATVRGSDSFKTTNGRIVNRDEGLVLATRGKQTTVPNVPYAQLHSSDLKPAAAFVNEAHDILGLPKPQVEVGSTVADAAQRANDVKAIKRDLGNWAKPKKSLRELLGLDENGNELYGPYAGKTKVEATGRIEPSPGALANKDTQPFETQQLTKPLADHTGEELNLLQRKVEKARARAQVSIDAGAIGTTKPMEYDLQVLNDERARRAALTGPRREQATVIPRPEGAHQPLWDIATTIRQRNGFTHPPLPMVEKASPQAGKFMSQTYDRLVSEPENPVVQHAYRTFVDETKAQYADLQKAGYTFDFVEHDPYKNSADMLKDLRENKHLSVYKTKPGEGHPLMTAEENDVFRGVHDALGHGIHGNQFGPKGEENAFRAHSYLYSPEAQRVLATETRGQNSWYNFGPESSKPVGQRAFAEQKAALWPKNQLGDYPSVLQNHRAPPSDIEVRSAPKPEPRKVYHGTSSSTNFGIPTRTTDIGAHVGTPGQAQSILTGSDIGPVSSIEDLPEGGRILPLELRADAKLAKITRDLGDWHPHELAAQLLKDNIITKDEAKGLLAQFADEVKSKQGGGIQYTDREIRAANAEIVKNLLEKKGYAGIEYPNKYEASGWDETSHPDHPRMLKAPSQVIFRPMKDLRNPLLSEKAFEAEKKAEMTRRGIPSVIAGEPTPKKLLAENLKRYPRGEPSAWIGGAPPAGPPKLGLPDEHVRGLAMNIAADKQFMNESPLSIIKRRYPHYAPYLDAKSTAKIEQLAKKFRAITYRFTPFDATRTVKGVTRPSIASLAGSDEGQAIRKWYEGWKGAVGDALPPDAAEMLTRFSSILSAQASPEKEVGMALAALDKWAHGEKPTTEAFMGNTPERYKQLALAAADQRWGKQAFKTSGYYLARKGFKQTGALDRHVIRAYLGTDRVTPAQYEALWHRVNADADRMGLPFDEMQAAIWGGQTKYKAGAGEAGAAPEDWLAYHLASGNFDRLIKKYPGLEKLRAQGEQAVERQGMSDSGLLGDVDF